MSRGAPHPAPLLRPGLVRLAWRRALPLPVLLLLALVGVLAAVQDWGLPTDVLATASTARGFVRQGIWTLLVLVIAPLLVHRAAATFHEWREADADWLAPWPGGAPSLFLSTFAGLGLAALLGLGLTAALAEAAVGASGPTHRLRRHLETPSAILFDGDAPVRFVPEDLPLVSLPPRALVRVHLTVAPGSGPAATARVTVSSTATPPGEGENSTRVRLFGRRWVEVVAPPAGPGALSLEIAREGGEGAAVFLPANAVEILAPVANDRRVAGDLLLRLLLASAAGIALALGLGAWMRPALASTLVLAAWVLPWWWGLGAAWMPGGDLPAVWSALGEGLAPPVRGGTEWLAAGGALLLGFALAVLGAARGRRVG